MEASRNSKEKALFSIAFDFYATNLNTKLILIIDDSFNKVSTNPILFEKAIKLLSTLLQFPNIDLLLTTPSDTPLLRLTRYLTKLEGLLQTSPNLTTLICEQLERVVSLCQVTWPVELIYSRIRSFMSHYEMNSPILLSLLNFGVMTGDRDTCLKCLESLVDMLLINPSRFNEESVIACQKNIETYSKGDVSKEMTHAVMMIIERGKL